MRTSTSRGPRIPTGTELATRDAHHARFVNEAEDAERFSRERLLEVLAYMPFIRTCRERSKPILPRRVPKRILAMVKQLCLV